MVALSPDFGATWDERALQAYGDQIWSFMIGARSRAGIDISFGYTRIYGGFVEFVSAAVQRLIPADPYVVRHAVNAVFGWVGVVFAFLMAWRLFGIGAGWLAAILMIAMPRYVAESMNNTKDLPFAVLMLAGLYFIVTLKPQYPYLPWGHGARLAAAVALALNVRSMGLVLLGYAGVGLLVALLTARERSVARLAEVAGRFAVVTVIALVAGTTFWPWAQEQPLVRPVQAFFLASGFSWGNPSLFGGRYLPSNSLPWHYLPSWLLMTLPAVVVVGIVLSLWRLAGRTESRVQLAALWAFVLLPSTMVVVRNLSLYDGIRHVYFVVPPLVVIAAAGWDRVFQLGRGRAMWVAAGVCALGVAEPLAFQVRNHPNQTVYFSPLMGGPRAAFGRYELDYWGNCVLEAVDWSARQARRAGMPLGVTANAWEVAVADMSRYPALWFRQRRHGGYHLDIRLLKGSPEDVVATARMPEVLYRVTTADGTPLCVVLPGPEYPQLEARLARIAAESTP